MNLTCSQCNKVYKKPKCFDKHMRICDNGASGASGTSTGTSTTIDRDTDSRSDVHLKENEQGIRKIHNYTEWLNSIILDHKYTFDYLVNNSIESSIIHAIKLNIQTISPFYALENKIIILDNTFRYFKNEDIIKLTTLIHHKITQIVCIWNEKNLDNIKQYEHYQCEYFNVLDKITTSIDTNRKRINSSIKQLINNIVS